MANELYYLYHNYKGTKIKYNTFYSRIKKGGLSFEEAILDFKKPQNSSDKEYINYNNYNGVKCTYRLFRERLRRGFSFEDSISPNKIAKQSITKANQHGRVCTKCKISKSWSYFYKSKVGYNGFSSYCKECNKIRVQKYNNKNKDTLNKNRKIYKSYGRGKRLYELDIIFYSDKNIKKIIKLQGKQRKKKEVGLDKYWYFVNKGEDKQEMADLYLKGVQPGRLPGTNE